MSLLNLTEDYTMVLIEMSESDLQDLDNVILTMYMVELAVY